MHTITVDKNQAGQRFDKFLNKYLPNAGNGFIHKMLRKKNITLTGAKAAGNEILIKGDVIAVYFSDETFNKFKASNTKFPDTEIYLSAFKTLKNIEILYEDEDILVLNKPSGVLTQKAKSSDLSLNEWLIGYLLYEKKITNEELSTFHPSVCNRLDRNTGGIVMCGKSLAGSQFLSAIIKDRNLHKFYRTICVGVLPKDLLMEGYISKDTSSNKVTISAEPSDKGDGYIKTKIHPIHHNGEYSYLEVELFTGKTHQIRAHLSSIAHPIIGDCKYGNAEINDFVQSKFGLKNQLLHACRVVFPDEMPDKFEGKFDYLCKMEITAPLPEKFRNILDMLWTEEYK